MTGLPGMINSYVVFCASSHIKQTSMDCWSFWGKLNSLPGIFVFQNRKMDQLNSAMKQIIADFLDLVPLIFL